MKIGRGISTAIAAHNVLATGVHGVGVSIVATIANIATHAALVATHGVAGTIAGLADIAAHSALATGVHNVGASVVASVANIATHAGLTTGVHGAGASTIAGIDDIATHAALPTVHQDAPALIITHTTPDAHHVAFVAADADAKIAALKYKMVLVRVHHDGSPSAWLRTIPAGSLVLFMQANTIEAFNGDVPKIEVGDATDPDGFMSLSGTNLTTTGYKISGVSDFGLYLYDDTHKYHPKVVIAETDVIATLTLSGASSGMVDFTIWYLVS